jgi:hypothetical protein
MDSMSDELKETIIREHPGGIWLVLAEEYPPDLVTASDLLCGTHRATVIPFPRPQVSDQGVINPALTD